MASGEETGIMDTQPFKECKTQLLGMNEILTSEHLPKIEDLLGHWVVGRYAQDEDADKGERSDASDVVFAGVDM